MFFVGIILHLWGVPKMKGFRKLTNSEYAPRTTLNQAYTSGALMVIHCRYVQCLRVSEQYWEPALL